MRLIRIVTGVLLVLLTVGITAGHTMQGEQRPDGAVLLTESPPGSSSQNPAFSPDGTRMIFTRFENGYNVGPSSIYLLDLDSGDVALLTTAPDSDNVNLPGSSCNAETNRIAFSSDRGETDEIWTMDDNGDDLQRITDHDPDSGHFIEPSFSPDGEWIVFEVSSDDEQGSIWKIRTSGSDLTLLIDDPDFDDRQPNWSPMDERILFQRRELDNDNWDIYTVDPDGDDLHQVTDSPGGDTDASWSPDGEWIVYSSDDDLETASIFVIPAEEGEAVRVTFDDSRYDGAPSWSPDGEWIAFESHPGDDDAPSELWIIAVRTG